jgi:hypothetical protein
MPYRHLHIWLLLLLPLTFLAFAPGYFAIFTSASWAFHIHGATATAWIALLAFQSWSIHRRRNALHRAAGIASLALFPFFLAGSLLILHSMAAKFASGTDLFYGPFAAQLAAIDTVATIAIGWFYWEGLRARRNVQLHPRWLAATILFLLSPVFGRLIAILVPGLMIRGPEDFGNFPPAVRIANVVVLLIALWLARRAGRHARPMLVAAVLVVLQIILFELAPGFAPWESLLVAISRVPAAAVFAVGAAIGGLLAWLGWAAVPTRPTRSAEVA